MYPLEEGQSYPYQQWYIAGWADELSHKITEKTLLGEQIAFYRTEAGDPVAVQGLCPHRLYPFVKGRLVGDNIQCGYHGFTFEPGGACVRIPSQAKVPPRFRVRTFPLATRWDWVWIWMGDPERADPGLIPDLSSMGLGSPGWQANRAGYLHLDARYTLLIDNLLDLTHIGFIHASSVNDDVPDASNMMIEEHSDRISVSHRLSGLELSGFEKFIYPEYQGQVQKMFRSDYWGPSIINAAITWYAFENGEATRELGSINFLHGITPETLHSTHYYTAFVRNVRTTDEKFSESMRLQNLRVVSQDKDALALIEPHANRRVGSMRELSAMADGAGVRARRRLSAQIRAENTAVTAQSA